VFKTYFNWMMCSRGHGSAILSAVAGVIIALNLSFIRRLVPSLYGIPSPRPVAPNQNAILLANNTSVAEKPSRFNSSKNIPVAILGEANDAPSNPDGPYLHVAWLMTYPNSGTTYTMRNIQQYTITTTATNYGKEQSSYKPSIPVHPDWVDGPFLRYPTRRKPSKYILTKTHCGGYCDSCRPAEMDYESFEAACRTGRRIAENATSVRSMYPPDVPKRAVHLVRNPFDNVVARYHHRRKSWARLHDDLLEVFNETRDGFRAYCADKDRRDLKENLSYFRELDDVQLFRAASQLPCHAEFMRYTFWHNRATEVTEGKGIPVLTLYYDDYSLDWENNVKRLFEFLFLSPAEGAEPLAFIPGKEYTDFYHRNEIGMAKILVSRLATNATWGLLSRYFSGKTS
jgi:Sulfotransferase domain